MKYKWLCSLVLISPLVVKDTGGVRTTTRTNSVFSNNLEPISETDFTKPKRVYDTNFKLVSAYDYVRPECSFTMKLTEDNGIKYITPTGTGFIRTDGSRTWRNMNPGAIRQSPFARRMGAIGSAGGFAVFPSETVGMNALINLLKSDSYKELTVYNAIHKYAPFCDNNDPVRYQRHLHEQTGIDTNRKLCDLSDEEITKIAGCIKKLEGWIPGCEKYISSTENLLEILGSIKNKKMI